MWGLPYSFFLLMKVNTKVGTSIGFELCFLCFSACGAIGGLTQVSQTKVRGKNWKCELIGEYFLSFLKSGSPWDISGLRCVVLYTLSRVKSIRVFILTRKVRITISFEGVSACEFEFLPVSSQTSNSLCTPHVQHLWSTLLHPRSVTFLDRSFF